MYNKPAASEITQLLAAAQQALNVFNGLHHEGRADGPVSVALRAAIAGVEGREKNRMDKPLEPVEPDAEDVALCLTGALPGCPFCGHRAITINSYRADTGVYRTRVACTGTECMAEIGANYRTKDEARKAAIIKWSRRV